ncbi:hypothetical protein BSLG_005926 [Batrachochytrium salamandrivorans]|nr:hypothetical protein BSLG_005926 [Batrachochytrium salamandrivorans]
MQSSKHTSDDKSGHEMVADNRQDMPAASGPVTDLWASTATAADHDDPWGFGSSDATLTLSRKDHSMTTANTSIAFLNTPIQAETVYLALVLQSLHSRHQSSSAILGIHPPTPTLMEFMDILNKYESGQDVDLAAMTHPRHIELIGVTDPSNNHDSADITDHLDINASLSSTDMHTAGLYSRSSESDLSSSMSEDPTRSNSLIHGVVLAMLLLLMMYGRISYGKTIRISRFASLKAFSTFMASTGGLAIITAGGVLSGGGMSGVKMMRRTRGIEEFEFLDWKMLSILLIKTVSSEKQIGENVEGMNLESNQEKSNRKNQTRPPRWSKSNNPKADILWEISSVADSHAGEDPRQSVLLNVDEISTGDQDANTGNDELQHGILGQVGLRPVNDVPGIENMDLSDTVKDTEEEEERLEIEQERLEAKEQREREREERNQKRLTRLCNGTKERQIEIERKRKEKEDAAIAAAILAARQESRSGNGDYADFFVYWETTRNSIHITTIVIAPNPDSLTAISASSSQPPSRVASEIIHHDMTKNPADLSGAVNQNQCATSHSVDESITSEDALQLDMLHQQMNDLDGI